MPAIACNSPARSIVNDPVRVNEQIVAAELRRVHVVRHVGGRRRYVEAFRTGVPEVDLGRHLGGLNRCDQQSQVVGHECSSRLQQSPPRVGVVSQHAGFVGQASELIGHHDVDQFGQFD
jgi:hypothetical protein